MLEKMGWKDRRDRWIWQEILLDVIVVTVVIVVIIAAIGMYL